MNNKIIKIVPMKPNSSPIRVKIKSVCFSGKYCKYDWVPSKKPLPEKPQSLSYF